MEKNAMANLPFPSSPIPIEKNVTSEWSNATMNKIREEEAHAQCLPHRVITGKMVFHVTVTKQKEHTAMPTRIHGIENAYGESHMSTLG